MQKVSEEKQQGGSRRLIHVDTKRAMIGGLFAAGSIFAGAFIINVSSGSDARLLLESMLPSVRFLCSAVMTASSTILALMLTMLSMSSSGEQQFKTEYYERVRQIAWVDTAVFAAAIILLLFISIPLSESQDVPANWYTVLYYFTLAATALLGGALISVVMMLYRAVTGLIEAKHPQADSPLIEE